MNTSSQPSAISTQPKADSLLLTAIIEQIDTLIAQAQAIAGECEELLEKLSIKKGI